VISIASAMVLPFVAVIKSCGIVSAAGVLKGYFRVYIKYVTAILIPVLLFVKTARFCLSLFLSPLFPKELIITQQLAVYLRLTHNILYVFFEKYS